jgi:hypothetical protein
MGLASQKNHMAVYLMCCYGHKPTYEWFVSQWKKAGKKLDMGKSCVRFKKLDDLALDVLGAVIRRVPAKKYIEHYEAALAGMKKPAAKKASLKSSNKPTARKRK